MKTPLKTLACLLALSTSGFGAGLDSFKLTPEWESKIQQTAPDNAPVKPKADRKVLVFSLATGYKHWCIPHTSAMVKILGEKSGAYTTVQSDDIEQFLPENISQYDAIVLNNSCPDRKDRNTLLDVLVNKVDQFGAKYKDLPLEEREALAHKLYTSLTTYIAEGGGLIILHGGISAFNNSDEFSAIVGGSFNFHPKQQQVTLNTVDHAHPLTKPFGGEPFVHFDEPYLFNRAYTKLNFRPLLEMDVAKLQPDKRAKDIAKIPRYVSWIKRHKQGRVFFCSPSHNARSFEQPALLEFILGGIQYTLGDLECPDAPLPHQHSR
jgi:type 1 glutamine amidotransferase